MLRSDLKIFEWESKTLLESNQLRNVNTVNGILRPSPLIQGYLTIRNQVIAFVVNTGENFTANNISI